MGAAPDTISLGDTEHAAADAERRFLRIENVSKRFGDVPAVNQISFDIARGECFALLGPSGCGKSTLLRMIAGLDTADEGRIVLDGVDLAPMPPHRRPINMMFQSYALFPHMTVESNIGFGLRQERRPRGEIAERVAAMLALVQLEGLGSRKPDQLSGGQRQRVALARALVKQPKVLLLDEPLAALDKKLRQETQAQLRALQRQLGTTFIIVTHDQEEAMALADRMAVMERGRIAQMGTPAELYERPNSRSVARFIGDINLLEGTLARSERGTTQVDCGALGVFQVASATPVAAGTQVALALRPELLSLGTAPPAAGLNGLEGVVAGVAYRGERTVYTVAGAGDATLQVTRAVSAGRGAPGFARGDRVWITWPADAGVLLDR